MGIEDIRDALIIRERSSFLLTDPSGNAPRGNAQGLGLYHADTRHLSTYSFSLNGIAPVLLLSTAELGFAMEQMMTNPTLTSHDGRRISRGSVEIRRQRVVSDVVEERLRVTNFNSFPVTLHLLYDLGADFADIFDVRGYERERRGKLDQPTVAERSVQYGYLGIDGLRRETHVEFDTKPDFIDESSAMFRIVLQRREAMTLRMDISMNEHTDMAPRGARFERVAEQYRRWTEDCTQIFTDNEFFNRVMARALHDVRMLWSENEARQQFPAAGTPWFDALFGRDSCIVAMQMLPYRPQIARDTLRLLAHWQGTQVDPVRDEEPGKIVHELRYGELSRANELPYGPYYGSIDSTPLFLMLITEYYDWTGDLRLVRELLPAIKAALRWMDEYGDIQNEGFLAYEKRSMKGLVNQGWKDSFDAIAHVDGTLAQAPVALAEVQGYAYSAWSRLSPILDRLGETALASKLGEQAEQLRRRFDREFWVADQRYFAMALDGAHKPVASVSSNPGHCLWTGLIEATRSGDVVTRLMQNDMFSGWGLRTLTAASVRFNPIGYHVGSVWPHDNSIAAMGFKKYGCEEEVNEVATALFDAAAAFPYFRLPELFGGEARSAHNTPVPYPVACRPQAWAAGAFPLITQAILGLKPEAPNKLLRIVNPKLPYWLNSVHVRGLRVGSGHVTLQYRRTGGSTHVEVQKATGGIDVTFSKRWPL